MAKYKRIKGKFNIISNERNENKNNWVFSASDWQKLEGCDNSVGKGVINSPFDTLLVGG